MAKEKSIYLFIYLVATEGSQLKKKEMNNFLSQLQPKGSRKIAPQLKRLPTLLQLLIS